LRCIECNDEKKKTGQNWGATTGNTIVGETVEIAGEKQDVVPDVETSLGQQDDQNNITDDIVEPNAEVQDKNASNNDEILPTDKDKKNATKSQEVVGDSDGERTVEHDDNIVDLDDESSDLNHTIANTYRGSSVEKRLRSSSGKVVPAVAKTPITRMKSVVVGPKKGWSKITPKATTGKKTKERKIVESSDSEYEHVEEDVSHIPLSTSKKSTSQKTSLVSMLCKLTISLFTILIMHIGGNMSST
jgi:hypothetical protein